MSPADEGLTRRAALALLGGGAAAVLVGGTVVLRSRDDDDAPAAPSTPDPLPDAASRLEGIALVGARYRELVPEEDDEAALLSALGMPAELPDTPGALEAELGAQRDRIRADFSEGEVVTIDGWTLSVTEARLSALVSLSS